ncbi:hypothetical protein SH203_01937 [Brevundimonas sp. SH203]|uniref:hypothetical protein n=1 Tax=Brevundimonas sp. SH203 TaxID=345167 RepID=UPI0009D01AA6|nr:hypothetical protein [Brevundimonas sp. SH203]GAW41529.1 hypothetical protein SH203_01937 [Brevundimonas sp. SH203]
MMGFVVGAIAALTVSGGVPVQEPAPLLIWQDQTLFLPPPADTPLYSVKVGWGRMSEWTPWVNGEQASERIRRIVRPEPFEVEGFDDADQTLNVRTSAYGRSLLQRSLVQVFNPVDEYAWGSETCDRTFVTFKVGASAPPVEPVSRNRNWLCPHGEQVDTERNLIVEGLDGQGRRIFVALSDDPRWNIHETGDSSGRIELLRRGRDDAPETHVEFTVAPFGDDLAQLKIWQFEADGESRVIATVDMTHPAPTD